MTASFVGGAIGGALLTAALLLLARGLLSPIPRVVLVIAGIAVAGTIALAAMVRGDCPLWQTRRQIDAALVVGRTPTGASAYGFQLGTGLATYLPSCAPHVLAVLLVAMPVSVFAIALAAVGFGIGRSAGFVARSLAVNRDAFEARFQRGVAILVRVAPALIVVGVLTNAAAAR